MDSKQNNDSQLPTHKQQSLKKSWQTPKLVQISIEETASGPILSTAESGFSRPS